MQESETKQRDPGYIGDGSAVVQAIHQVLNPGAA
jgi:hypothetical protein